MGSCDAWTKAYLHTDFQTRTNLIKMGRTGEKDLLAKYHQQLFLHPVCRVHLGSHHLPQSIPPSWWCTRAKVHPWKVTNTLFFLLCSPCSCAQNNSLQTQAQEMVTVSLSGQRKATRQFFSYEPSYELAILLCGSLVGQGSPDFTNGISCNVCH